MSVSTPSTPRLDELDPATYVPHTVHGEGRTYRETNCWTDVVIELLHARGYEPLAAMGATARLDFEGDQWSFFKPHPVDMELLFGVDIHEMQPYRFIPDQVQAQLQRGRSMLIEVDGWFLPDTAGTSYHREHVKTTIAVAAIDQANERLRYFHNAGFYALNDADYRGLFRTDGSTVDVPPPYTEIARFDCGPALAGTGLRAAATERLRYHLALRPTTNPFPRFGTQLALDLPTLLERDAAHFHEYAFATVRMAGAGFELLGSHVGWLLGDAGAPATEAIDRIVEDCKLLSFKLARRRAFDPDPVVQRLAATWDDAMTHLDGAVA